MEQANVSPAPTLYQHLTDIIFRKLLNCIKKLVLCDKESDKESEEDTADDWIKLVDRGGLWHVRETTFQVFFALEEGVRQYLAQLASVAAKQLASVAAKPALKSNFL